MSHRSPTGAERRCAPDCGHGRSERAAGRRAVLTGVGAVAATALAGCLEGDEDGSAAPAEPVDLHGQPCDACGMVIGDHYGPAGQLFYADADGPLVFDSVAELLEVYGARDSGSDELRGVFVTDYSGVDYEVDERDGTAYISSHVAADDVADATELRFVADSGVQGAMGPAIVPFSEAGDADAFVADHGGTRRSWNELTG